MNTSKRAFDTSRADLFSEPQEPLTYWQEPDGALARSNLTIRIPRTALSVLSWPAATCSGADMEYWWLPPELKQYRDRIHFTWWLTPAQLAEWYLFADVLAVPSWYEPSSSSPEHRLAQKINGGVATEGHPYKMS